MNFLSRLMDSFRFSDDEDDEFFGNEDEYDLPSSPKKNSYSASEEIDEFDMDEEETRPRFFSKPSPKVVPMRKKMQLTMVKPTSIEDASEICDHLLDGTAVVLNVEGLHTELAQRIIDFTSGATYTLNGNLQKISTYIFIATPESVTLSGDFPELLNSSSMEMSGMKDFQSNGYPI